MLAAAALLLSLSTVSTSEPQRWLLFPVDVTAYKEFTSPFGPRRLHRVTRHHAGIDLSAPSGSWVVAAREGIIREISYERRSGWYLKIEHPHGWATVYCHLKEDPRRLGLYTGMSVGAAQVIGRVGSTGRSTGPHLHFVLIAPHGTRVDPVPHLLTPLETYTLLTSRR